MPDYPPDIMEKAREAHNAAMRMGMLRVGSPYLPIAAAILAERQRCAEVARDHQPATQDMTSLERRAFPGAVVSVFVVLGGLAYWFITLFF